MNQRKQLEQYSIIVADTGDIDAVKKYHPQDATTNPSLILKAVQQPQYRPLIEEAVHFGRKNSLSAKNQQLLIMDYLFVIFGREILKIVPGRVSTEVDAHLSFDIKGSIAKAESLINLYEQQGVSRERILIKLATTWEGIKAAAQLEKKGIHCNMTLLFSLPQAILCAKAKATLISPFVGRILDWHKKNAPNETYSPSEDPGVKSVTEIYNYLKKYDYKTQVMAASFRNKEEIIELAGCDLLTISPDLLNQLENSEEPIHQKLTSRRAKEMKIPKLNFNENQFRYALNESAMATEKLAEGIRTFAADASKLQDFIQKNFP